jgi:hypothetical protein
MNWKGHGKKRSWPNLKYYIGVFFKRTDEIHEKSQSVQISGDLKPVWVSMITNAIRHKPDAYLQVTLSISQLPTVLLELFISGTKH